MNFKLFSVAVAACLIISVANASDNAAMGTSVSTPAPLSMYHVSITLSGQDAFGQASVDIFARPGEAGRVSETVNDLAERHPRNWNYVYNIQLTPQGNQAQLDVIVYKEIYPTDGSAPADDGSDTHEVGSFHGKLDLTMGAAWSTNGTVSIDVQSMEAGNHARK